MNRLNTSLILLAIAICTHTGSAQIPERAAELGRELVRHGVPGGIVMSAPQLRQPFTQRETPTEAETRTFRSSLESLTQRFGGNNNFSVSVDNEVVHIRDDGEPSAVRQMLQQVSQVPETKGITVQAALSRLVIGALIGREPTGGIAGTGIPPVEECSLTRRIDVSGGAKSSADLLDEIVTQVPGLVWVVTYDPAQSGFNLKVGLMCRGGRWTTLTVPF